MSKIFFFLLLIVLFSCPLPVFGQTSISQKVSVALQSSGSGQASQSAAPTQKATASAALELIEKTEKENLTQPKETVPRLEALLRQQELQPLTISNFLRHAIHRAVSRGVPANTIVLILLFPLVAAIIAFARNIIGLTAFGILTPAAVSVAFLATGITAGVLLFLSIVFAATIARMILKPLHLQYLPRMALVLWFVSLAALIAVFLAPELNLQALTTVSIFPILLMILLSETFTDVQLKKGMAQAASQTIVTLILASISYFVLNFQPLQDFVLLNAELTVLSLAGINVLLGRYTGLRLTEIFTFKKIR